MLQSKRELWYALAAVLVITLLYGAVVLVFREIPEASGLFGHLIGVAGFGLMLSTETLYSLRKRTRIARWGKMSSWLQFHIFTGIVGPYMVLLHSSWKLNGLAGITLLLTVIIVISGFIGRYIFTAIPRTADGIELERETLLQQLQSIEQSLAGRMGSFAGEAATASAGQPAQVGRPAVEAREHQEWIRRARRQGGEMKQQAAEMEKLVRRQKSLRRQVNSLATARRMLSVWHSVHIPIGMALFTAATIHIISALYYATLLR